jgi:hypothetical protein
MTTRIEAIVLDFGWVLATVYRADLHGATEQY